MGEWAEQPRQEPRERVTADPVPRPAPSPAPARRPPLPRDVGDGDLEPAARSGMAQAFQLHARVYVLVNLFLIGVWAATGGGSFWPVWPILGWGLAVGIQGGVTYGRR